MRVLIIEDEVRLANTLADIMSEHKNAVDISHDGISGLDNALSGIYDVIILDIMLPGMNGYEVLKKMRSSNNAVPVLLLSAKSELEDRIRGLNEGADYYLQKPFEIQELLACMGAILRRGEHYESEKKTFGDLSLDVSSFELSCREKSVHLSAKEMEILRILMSSKGRIVSKEQLLTRVWGFESEAEDNHVEVYISFLRKKLKLLHSSVSISVMRRVGYFMEDGNDL